MSEDELTYMGRPVTEMSKDELIEALKKAVNLYNEQLEINIEDATILKRFKRWGLK